LRLVGAGADHLGAGGHRLCRRRHRARGRLGLRRESHGLDIFSRSGHPARYAGSDDPIPRHARRPRPMTRAILALLLLASLAAPALAQQRVEIAADLFTVEEASHEAIFTGNVLVEHPSVTVWADRVVATYGAGGT